MAIDKIEKIKKIDSDYKSPGTAAEPKTDYFESLMRQRRVQADTSTAQIDEAKKTQNSIFDEVRELNNKVDYAKRATPGEVAAQADGVIAQIQSIKATLSQPDVEIKGPAQTILRNKLHHIDENLKAALQNAGIEYHPPEKVTSLSKPVDRFITLLTHAQDQLQSLGGDVRTIAQSKSGFTPANMLLLQLKVNYVSQEVELFTSMLNKALESTKTIMNVQV